MIAKISKGGSFGGAVDYVLDKGKDAELLAGLGVRMKDRDSIVRSFRMQAALNPHLSKPVGHIVLAFSAQDAARLDNRRMVGIAAEYLSGMGIRNTQFIIARHRDREHPHLHILFNRVDNDGRTVSDRNDRYRSERLCKELTVRHGLYFASGKENVKEHRLREPDKTKYEIFHALRDAVPRCRDWPELTAALRHEGIATEFRMRGGTSDVQGVVFARNGYPYNGSHRSVTCSKIFCNRSTMRTKNGAFRNDCAKRENNTDFNRQYLLFMDTNTIIELFEELRKQLTSLSRRIDDRNISAPAPVTTDDKIARLLETAQFTRTNVERVRMELADRITTIGKETENHTEKIIAAVAHPAQPAAQRHIHVIDFNTSWALLYMAISFIVILCGGIHITKLYDRIANLRDTELKYRYVQMMGDIDEQKLRNLNALFYDSERRADRRSLRQQVERYETAVREAIENQQRSVIRKQEAEDIRQKAKQFQKELDITK